MIRERDEVVLTCGLPEQKLAAGDIGTFVRVHGERPASWPAVEDPAGQLWSGIESMARATKNILD